MPCARVRIAKACRGRVVWLAQGHAVMESKSEIPAPIIFLLGHPGFALCASSAVKSLLLANGSACSRTRCSGVTGVGALIFPEQRCSSKNRLSQRTWMPTIAIEIFHFPTVFEIYCSLLEAAEKVRDAVAIGKGIVEVDIHRHLWWRKTTCIRYHCRNTQ